jgi:predicted O-methyltransferase YrrM
VDGTTRKNGKLAMFYQIKAYFKFLLKSTNQHGVHSPFVYNLVTKCFYNNGSHKEYAQLKVFRKALVNNSNIINIKDFGSGSRMFKSNQRTISQMAKRSGITSKRAKFLFRLTKYFNANNILELGTLLGLGTSALSLGNNKAQIISIEGCPETASVAQNQFSTFKLNNIDLRVGTFENILPKIDISNNDLIFFDGNHTKEATLNYFEMLLPTATNNSVFIFDDIHWSKGMTEAWETIIKHPKVTVSIDTFFWGIIFFRKEQVKEHFVIRV